MRYDLQNGRLVPKGRYILNAAGGTRPECGENEHVVFDGWEISGQFIVPKYKTVANAARPAKAAPTEIPISDGTTDMKIRVVTNKLGDKTIEVVNTTQEQS